MRLFIAVCFDEETKMFLKDTMRRLEKHLKRGRFTLYENLHLTVVFIGETTRTSDVMRAMDGIEAEEFDLSLGGFGQFAREGGRIYWVGVGDGKPLVSVYSQLCAALRRDGFSIEARPYKPHLTLAREAAPEERFDERAFSDTIPKHKIRVSKISLMKSERIRGKLVYTCIHEKILNRGE